MENASSKERQILQVMRKVLASVIKEITPEPGMRHPLSEGTIDDVRNCLRLIAARERELAEQAGVEAERPFYADEPQKAQTVPFPKIDRAKDKDGG